ncbi:MAG: hypothetical protein KA004_05920 [Verrucomicrobiales bacterium]|nr:hypothetical protein [Verrucomicrobiales bacterium]
MRAFAPANISLIFETYDAELPHGRGSLGVGITLDEGAVVSVNPADEPGIFVHGESWEFPTVAQVMRELTDRPLRLDIQAAFPFGCGFGMSGASALAAAIAIDAFLDLGNARGDLGMIAHRAEVDHATGLGDVGGQFNGGIMIKTRKFEPLQVSQLPVKAENLHVRIFGPIHTPEVIGSRQKLLAVNAAGHSALAELGRCGADLTLDRLFAVSLQFAENSGLLQSERLVQCIRDAQAAGGRATMVMLGEAAVSTRPFPGSRRVRVLHGGVRLLP